MSKRMRAVRSTCVVLDSDTQAYRLATPYEARNGRLTLSPSERFEDVLRGDIYFDNNGVVLQLPELFEPAGDEDGLFSTEMLARDA